LLPSTATTFEGQARARGAELAPALVRARRNAQLICVWCGPVMLVAVGVGVVVLAGFVPGPSPATSAAQINARYLQNLSGIRAGMCLQMAGIALIAPWGAALAVQTHRGNPGTAIFTVTQIVCVAVTTIIGVLAPIAWGFASFRAGSQSPELTRTLNDLGWIVFIFDWSPIAVWYASVGLAIIMDRSEQPVFPRWAAYLSFWTAGLSAPGGLTILFKHGPLAYNGLLSLWIPLGVFGIWISAMTVLVIQGIHREAQPTKSLLV
jgi:hypothetical protein